MADASPAPRIASLVMGAVPMGLVGLLYEAMGAFRSVGVSAETVHVCDVRGRELALFGVHGRGGVVTPNDWWQQHPVPLLDLLCAVPYAGFLLVCVACAVWLYVRDPRRMARFAWCFLALNVAGFVTYHVYPVAPPWYYHAHGCAVDAAAAASEGPALARVDSLLGVSYFARMYASSNCVFGAVPSLHVGYALLVCLEGWDSFSATWRAASAAFFALMCFSAVYLDHHWVQDVVAGAAYSAVVSGAARAFGARTAATTA
jgi:membrane-associated phospholipid phosphatase